MARVVRDLQERQRVAVEMLNHLGRQIDQGYALVGVSIHVQYRMNSVQSEKNRRREGIHGEPSTL